jgi:hypothetical protein
MLQSNPMFASSPPFTRGLDANKKNEIWSAGSQDISSLNLGVVNSSQKVRYDVHCNQDWLKELSYGTVGEVVVLLTKAKDELTLGIWRIQSWIWKKPTGPNKCLASNI